MTNNIPRAKTKPADSRGTTLDMEKCVANIGSNRFNLVLIAAARAREIRRRHKDSDRREHTFPIVTALQEIQSGEIGAEYIQKVK